MEQKTPLVKLVNELSKLPGVGEKTATRLAFHILKSDHAYAKSLSQSILEIKEKIRLCSICFDLTEHNPCALCSNAHRNETEICVVEEPQDMMAIEKAKVFSGTYHILHGTLSPIHNIGPDQLKVRELLTRLQTKDVQEIILATNPSVEGEATALYLVKLLKQFPIKITRIAHGVPTGGDLEYIDTATIGNAMKYRVTL
ncbi:MAG: recombination protein RecR [Deltaproteobacteria bacterium RIFCSPHIGHO2_02_FULL_40_11]|nr:MAG: recombination protein RecR [Deltaproteobacteria bacterium RIFCSPHIGHO2_02_FULL_40_11]